MLIRTLIGAVLGAALAASAQAQSFDGTYVGTRTITFSQSGHGGPAPGCPGTGGMRTAIEFKVAGGSITLRYRLRRDVVFAGTIRPDGAFSITSPWEGAMVTWSGRIKGRRLQGDLVGSGPGNGSCRGTLTARKRS